ncbi:protein phosphatase 2C domain-containing protein [Pseudomonas sp. SJZ131]|uniref:protein phosphatase 2C domain-containing protein n=1 Tax=Pseudomonas sp. SJZ131 TaxID=2572895 RepID=UPI0011A88F02|nr:protein phosphatase 2C domain-containing protein [Pseudomonas sp. SJZ131]
MSELTMNFSTKTACAFVAGRAQLQTDTPGRAYAAARESNDVTCIAAADGASFRAHSAIGAQVAVTAALGFVCKNFESLWQNMDKHNAKAAQRLVNRCLDAFRRKSNKLACDSGELGCSLSFVAYSGGRYLAGHLSDGLMVSVDAAGQLQTLFAAETAEHAAAKPLLTEPKAASRLKLMRGPIEALTGFALISEGSAQSLCDDGVPAPAILQWLESNATLPRKKIKSALADNLQQLASDHDSAIGLLSLRLREALPQ